MAGALHRELSEHERGVLDLLLSVDFPGVRELREQARSVRVRDAGAACPTLVELEVADTGAPRAPVVHLVPVETTTAGPPPQQEVLLLVRGGQLDSLEVVTYGLAEPVGFPSAEELDPPVALQRTPRLLLDPGPPPA